MKTDRRSTRSEVPVHALRLLLEACRVRGGYEEVIVADEHGFLVGSSSADEAVARELAAELAIREFDAPGSTRRIPFRVMDRTLYVSAVGDGGAAPLLEAVYGARRILAA